jgi:uncharacterized protein (DUF2062 family)
MKKIKSTLKQLYVKLFKIDDTPGKIALGFGLGVFSGIFPGTGPLAALFFAFIFRANRASALLGSLLTNTWLSFLTFIFAIKLGSAILGISWLKVKEDWVNFLTHFHWWGLFKLSVLKIILPVMAGYLLVSLFLGLLTYLVVLMVIRKLRS